MADDDAGGLGRSDPESSEWSAPDAGPEPPLTEAVAAPIEAEGHAPATTASPTPKKKRGLLFAAAAAAIALVIVVAVIVTPGGGGSTGSAEAQVVSAVHSALADKTAHIVMTISGDANGTQVNAQGSGAMDFSQDALEVTLPVTVGGQQLDLKELYAGNTIYEGFPQLSQLEPGKSWIAMDLSGLAPSSNASTIGNPAAMLQLLAAQGNTVTALGASTVDGQVVSGFAVTINPAAVRAQLSKANLPDWIRQAVSNVDFGPSSINVYIDGQGRLVREAVQIQVSAGVQAVATNATVDFSDYGTPVSITAPPADQTVSFQQFLQDAKNASGG